jgi:hypothetical protein
MVQSNAPSVNQLAAMDIFRARAIARGMKDVELGQLFDSLCTLSPAQLAQLNQEAVSACYDRRECHELGINYADVRRCDVMRAMVYRALADDIIPMEGAG